MFKVRSSSIPYVLVYKECELIRIQVTLTQVDTNMECILAMESEYGNPKWFGGCKGISQFLNNLCLYNIITCTQLFGGI